MELEHDLLVRKVIGCAIEVHRELGPGLLESAYQGCLSREFIVQGISFVRQAALPVLYKGHHVDCGYRLDFVVEQRLVLELKCIDQFASIHTAQLLTYLKLAKLPQGLIINFNVHLLKSGIKSVMLSRPPGGV